MRLDVPACACLRVDATPWTHSRGGSGICPNPVCYIRALINDQPKGTAMNEINPTPAVAAVASPASPGPPCSLQVSPAGEPPESLDPQPATPSEQPSAPFTPVPKEPPGAFGDSERRVVVHPAVSLAYTGSLCATLETLPNPATDCHQRPAPDLTLPMHELPISISVTAGNLWLSLAISNSRKGLALVCPVVSDLLRVSECRCQVVRKAGGIHAALTHKAWQA